MFLRSWNRILKHVATRFVFVFLLEFQVESSSTAEHKANLADWGQEVHFWSPKPAVITAPLF